MIDQKEIKEFLMKPKLRGYFHAFGFFFTLLTLLPFIFFFIFWQIDFYIILYFIVQLTQFGVSACYHIMKLSEKTERFMQRLDHISIFLLISGTQTAVLGSAPSRFIAKSKESLLNTIRTSKDSIISNSINNSLKEFFFNMSSIIKLSWTVAIIGIFRKVISKKPYRSLDVGIYIFHGILVAFSFQSIKNLYLFDFILVLLGGIFYICGGLIIGMEWPNPSPKTYGFHELFHTLTLFGNACFSIVIFKSYFYKVAVLK